MAQINTVLGPIDPSQLGRTLMHEHVLVLSPEIEKWPVGKGVDSCEEWDEEARVADAVEKLRELKAAGIDTVVDLTVIGLGRNVERLLRIARQVPEIHIVMATGLYTYNELPFFFKFRGPGTLAEGPEPMTEMWVRDLTRGAGGTEARAGILKCATDLQGITPDVERVIRSCAVAHRRTGIPITTHTPIPPEPYGLEQQRILREEGVDLTHVVIGHGGGTQNTQYQQEVMDNGSYLGLDRFGLDTFTFEQQIEMVVKLVGLGYADRIVLSHDAQCYGDWFPESFRDALPKWRYTHISQDVLPALREAGVGEDAIQKMMVDNPAAVLTPCDPY